MPWLPAVASRKIAFRANIAGITLGADPLSWPFRHASAVFVPWSDAEAIALYQGGGPFGWRIGDDPCIAIQPRQWWPGPRQFAGPGYLALMIACSCHAVTASRISRPPAKVNGTLLMWSSGNS